MGMFEKKNIKWLVLGGAAIGGLYYLRQRGGLFTLPSPGLQPDTGLPSTTKTPGSVFPGAPPAPVKKNESVRAVRFQYVTGPRDPRFKYYLAKLLPTQEVQFRSGVAGMFTRNVLQEGKRLWAEVRPQVDPMLAGFMGM